MQTKMLEVRDSATTIPALAIAVEGSDGWLARRAGYGDRCILFGYLNGGKFSYDPYDWDGGRTMKHAHHYVIENWDTLQNGDIVDVEFILKATTEKKVSEQYEVF